MTRFALLECLHRLDNVKTTIRKGGKVPCHDCAGAIREIVKVISTAGFYRAQCSDCDWHRDTGSAKKLAYLYGTRHHDDSPNHEVLVAWMGNEQSV